MLKLRLFGRFRAADALGNEIAIKSRKARALLAYLSLPPGKARSREQLATLLWSDRGDEQARGSLRQALSGLRRDLGDGLAEVLRIDDEAISLDPERVLVESRSSGDELLEGLPISDPAFEEWLRDERIRQEATVVAEVRPKRIELPDRSSIAVLPFVNMSGDPEQEYFADGITEDIITELARFNSLFVIARNSSFHFKGRSPKVQDAGRELGVAFVVEGSVRKSGGRVRITAQLVEAETGNHLWAERYDRDLEDIFAVQDDVVREIATAVSGRLQFATLKEIERRSVSNFTAYEFTLRGEALRHHDWGSVEAIPYFEKAIEADPNCARAHAHLANWHAYAVNRHGRPLEEARHLTRSHAEKAIQIAPNDPVILAAVAEAYVMIGDLKLARRWIDEAIRLNPNHYQIMIFAADVLAWLGDVEGALHWRDQFVRHDPSRAQASDEVDFEVFFFAKRFEEAISAISGWQDLPLHLLAESAAAHALAGHPESAVEFRRRFEERCPPDHTIQDHVKKVLMMCARQEQKDLWLLGYRKAGFDV